MKMQFFRLILFLGFLLNQHSLFSQCGQNSSPNPNYCCGHDPELVTQSAKHKTFSWGNLCGWGFYEQANSPPTYASSGDWMLVWNDEFNDYTKLNESFYRPVSQSAYNINDGDQAWIPPLSSNTKPFLYMHDPNLIKINQNGNGKLQLFENYDPDPTKATQLYSYGEPVTGTLLHSDYNVGHLETRFRFPQNCRIQGEIKTYPINTNQWPAFWTFGDNSIELDIFEMPYQPAPNIWNDQQLIATYHFRKYGFPGNTLKAEAVIHRTDYQTSQLFNLNNNFYLYELIWNNWSVQWWLNHDMIHRINRFYKLHSSWSSNKRKKHYRMLPVNDLATYNAHTDQLFAQNKFFPGFFYAKPDPVMIIFNNQLTTEHGPLNPANIDPSKSMDMDYLRVWAKADCSADRNVNSENINIAYQGQYSNPTQWPYINWIKRNYLETGGNLTFGNGNNVTLEETQLGLFVATNQIAFEDGFSVEENASMFAFLSYCEASWDNRETSTDPEPDSGPDDDDEPYYNPDGSIDTTDLVGQGFGNNGDRYTNGLDEETHGIIDMPTNTSANNIDLYQDILIKTEESGFTIESSGAKITSIELHDSKSSLILKERESETGIYTISRNILPEGIYTCIIYTTNGLDVRKIWVWR